MNPLQGYPPPVPFPVGTDPISNQDLTSYAGLAGLPIVIGLVDAIRVVPPLDRIPELYSLFAILFGVMWNLLVAWTFQSDLKRAMMIGVITGIAAITVHAQVKGGVDARATRAIRKQSKLSNTTTNLTAAESGTMTGGAMAHSLELSTPTIVNNTVVPPSVLPDIPSRSTAHAPMRSSPSTPVEVHR